MIAHHKSYHPYKADNIERVRRDEEEAALKEAKEEGRLKLAVSTHLPARTRHIPLFCMHVLSRLHTNSDLCRMQKLESTSYESARAFKVAQARTSVGRTMKILFLSPSELR